MFVLETKKGCKQHGFPRKHVGTDAGDPEAIIEVLKRVLVGDRFELEWRDKPSPPEAVVQNDPTWVSWVGVVYKEWADNAIIVDWDPRCARLVGKKRCYFPECFEWPDADCDYTLPRVTRAAKKMARREVPPTPPPPARRAATPPPQPRQHGASGDVVQISAAELKKLLAAKRPRETDSDDSDSSDEERYDREAGAKVPMRRVVDGLRMPKSPDASATAWYPHLWSSGQAWAIAMRAKLGEFCCSIKSMRLKRDIDLDIELVAELADLRAASPDPTSLTQHRNTFSVVARVIMNLLLTSPMATPNGAEQFGIAFAKALDIGRVDFAALMSSKLTAGSVTVEKIVAPAEQPTLKAESADYWKSVAEDANRQLQRERNRNEQREQRKGHDFRRSKTDDGIDIATGPRLHSDIDTKLKDSNAQHTGKFGKAAIDKRKHGNNSRTITDSRDRSVEDLCFGTRVDKSERTGSCLDIASQCAPASPGAVAGPSTKNICDGLRAPSLDTGMGNDDPGEQTGLVALSWERDRDSLIAPEVHPANEDGHHQGAYAGLVATEPGRPYHLGRCERHGRPT